MKETERIEMDADAIQKAIRRMAHEIIERHPSLETLVLAGIPTRGVEVARRRMNALEPRWGGSYEEMLSFGAELSRHVARRPPAGPRGQWYHRQPAVVHLRFRPHPARPWRARFCGALRRGHDCYKK